MIKEFKIGQKVRILKRLRLHPDDDGIRIVRTISDVPESIQYGLKYPNGDLSYDQRHEGLESVDQPDSIFKELLK